jgi:arylsulfatase A-like enzyme
MSAPSFEADFLRAGAAGGLAAALCDLAFGFVAQPPQEAAAALVLVVVSVSLFVAAGAIFGALCGFATRVLRVEQRRSIFLALRDDATAFAFARAVSSIVVGAGVSVIAGAALATFALETGGADAAALSVAFTTLLGVLVGAAASRLLRRVRLLRAATTTMTLTAVACALLAWLTRDDGPFEAIDARPIYALIAGAGIAVLASLRLARMTSTSEKSASPARARRRALVSRAAALGGVLGLAAFSLLHLSADADVRAASEAAPLTTRLLEGTRAVLGLGATARAPSLERLAAVAPTQTPREPRRVAPHSASAMPVPPRASPTDPTKASSTEAFVATPPPPHTSVVLLTIDALRADHLGAYGYPRDTSPALDEFAKDATVFERAYSQEAKTKGSIPSLFTSRWPSEIRWGGARYVPLAESESTLAERLLAAGYHTAAFVTHSYFMPGQGMDRGFVHYDASLVSRDPAVAFGRASGAALAKRVTEYVTHLLPDRPFFVWAHFFDPHERYLTHARFSRFGRRAIDRYDGEIAYTDHHVGRVLRALRARKDADRIAVVVTSDHGEAFGEHGTRFHGQSLYEEEIRVPLLLRVPKGVPSRVPTPVGVIDVAPTILELAGIPPAPEHRGRSLVAAARGATLSPRPMFAEILPEDRIRARTAVIHGDWKLIYDERRDALRLYHLREDPRERHNRLRRDALVASELAALLFRWRAREVPESPAPLGQARAPSRTLTTAGP